MAADNVTKTHVALYYSGSEDRPKDAFLTMGGRFEGIAVYGIRLPLEDVLPGNSKGITFDAEQNCFKIPASYPVEQWGSLPVMGRSKWVPERGLGSKSAPMQATCRNANPKFIGDFYALYKKSKSSIWQRRSGKPSTREVIRQAMQTYLEEGDAGKTLEKLASNTKIQSFVQEGQPLGDLLRGQQEKEEKARQAKEKAKTLPERRREASEDSAMSVESGSGEIGRAHV